MPPSIGKGAISVAFVHPSVWLSVAYIANNSRTQRPSMPKFGMKVPHLRCNSDPVSRSNGQRSGLEAGGGILCRLNLAATLLVEHWRMLYDILTDLQLHILVAEESAVWSEHLARVVVNAKLTWTLMGFTASVWVHYILWYNRVHSEYGHTLPAEQVLSICC